MKVVIDSQVRVTAGDGLRKKLAALATFPNPQWHTNNARGYSNWDTPRHIELFEDTGETVCLPRGLVNEIWGVLHHDGRKVNAVWEMSDRPFDGEYRRVEGCRYYQRNAQRAFDWQGRLVMPCGAGKTTYTGCDIISRVGQKTIVLVNNKDLMDQWKEDLENQIGVEAGIIQSKKKEFRDVTIAMIQTLTRQCSAELTALFKQFGFLLVDECHRYAANSWKRVVNLASCKYRMGMTATNYRNDGLTPILGALFGETFYDKVDQIELSSRGFLMKPVVQRVRTGCSPQEEQRNGQIDYNKLMEAICNDEKRRGIIADGIVRDVGAGHSCLCLATRKDYLDAIGEAVAKRAPEIEYRILTSDTGKTNRRQYIEEARDGTVKVIFGTQLADEGLNIPIISRMHLMLPSKAKSSTVQRIGRMMRCHETKTESPVLYDYVDDHPVCYASWNKRRRYYLEIGADIR